MGEGKGEREKGKGERKERKGEKEGEKREGEKKILLKSLFDCIFSYES